MTAIKNYFLYLTFMCFAIANAQKSQRIGFIDMEYILENIEEYNKAQSIINSKSSEWQSKIDQQQREVEILKENLSNERELLTADMIQEREEDIEIKVFELRELQAAYFGIKGDLYFMRTQLVKPIQDLVFNAVQEIAAKRNFDFIFDKSSELIMLYTNNAFNVSELVLTSIKRLEKEALIKQKKKDRKKEAKKLKEEAGAEEKTEVQKALDEVLEAEKQDFLDKKEAKKEELRKRIEERKEAIQKKRAERLKEIQERREKLNDEEKTEN